MRRQTGSLKRPGLVRPVARVTQSVSGHDSRFMHPLARVALLSTYYRPIIGGAEVATERLAGYLRRTGRGVTVVTKRPSVDVPEHEVIDGVAVLRRPPIGGRSPIAKWVWLPWATSALVALADRPDGCTVICAMDQRAAGLAALMAGRLRRLPVVLVPHTLGSLDGRHPLKRGLSALVHRAFTWPLRRCYTRADAIVCITRSILEEGRALGLPPERLHYVPNPVDIALFSPMSADARHDTRTEFGWSDTEVIVTFTGRLSREKGVRELLTVWGRLARPGRRLVLVGPDMPGHRWDEGPWVRAFMASAGLSDSVSLLGARPPAELARISAAADLAVLPSHFEAHPVAAIEAMACGLPIVASRVGSVPDFITHDRNGLIVEPRDTTGLEAALARLIDDPGLRARLGSAARATALQFDADVVLARFAAILDEISATDRPRGRGPGPRLFVRRAPQR
jgi:glycosyltransferase involved in cell wall biosynthesis